MLNFNFCYGNLDYKYLIIKNKINNYYNYIIDYNLIINKLIKNDIDKQKPSVDIINSKIINILENIIKNNNKSNILYVLKNANNNLIDIQNIINFYCKLYDKECSYVLHNFGKKEINIENFIIINYNINDKT